MKHIKLIVITLLYFSLLSCNNTLKENNENITNCPKKEDFNKLIETIKTFHKSRTDSTYGKSNLYDHDLDKKFAKSIDYLEYITNLKSHVYLGYVFEYTNDTDYQNDINQYSNWYKNNCSCTR